MTNGRIYLCALPKPFWESSTEATKLTLSEYVHDALASERRISKGINLENEYARYTLSCQRMEQIAANQINTRDVDVESEFRLVLASGSVPCVTLSTGYLHMLANVKNPDQWARLGRSFFPPDMVPDHRHAFNTWAATNELAGNIDVQQRSVFFDAAEKEGCGVIELYADFLAGDASGAPSTLAHQHDDHIDDQAYVIIPEYIVNAEEIEYFGNHGRKQRLAQTLRQQILYALDNDEPVTFGNQAPHDVITETLNQFVFVPPGEQLHPTKLRVAYVDGSESEPFPIFCLHEPQLPDGTPPHILRVALMSMRHLELDPVIDFCWFRNREVSRTRTLSETDQFCYSASLSQLNDSLSLGSLNMLMYHTGFEPAVIGFYRGLVQTLLGLGNATSSTISVTPIYFRGGDRYEPGRVWA